MDRFSYLTFVSVAEAARVNVKKFNEISEWNIIIKNSQQIGGISLRISEKFLLKIG